MSVSFPPMVQNKNKNYFYFILDKFAIVCYIDKKILK